MNFSIAWPFLAGMLAVLVTDFLSKRLQPFQVLGFLLAILALGAPKPLDVFLFIAIEALLLECAMPEPQKRVHWVLSSVLISSSLIPSLSPFSTELFCAGVILRFIAWPINGVLRDSTMNRQIYYGLLICLYLLKFGVEKNSVLAVTMIGCGALSALKRNPVPILLFCILGFALQDPKIILFSPLLMVTGLGFSMGIPFLGLSILSYRLGFVVPIEFGWTVTCLIGFLVGIGLVPNRERVSKSDFSAGVFGLLAIVVLLAPFQPDNWYYEDQKLFALSMAPALSFSFFKKALHALENLRTLFLDKILSFLFLRPRPTNSSERPIHILIRGESLGLESSTTFVLWIFFLGFTALGFLWIF